MDLDDLSRLKQLDPQDMLSYINGLPDQLQAAWDLGTTSPLPDWRGVQTVIIAGMGGSAIGADLVSAAVKDACSVPVFVHRDYGLPAFAKGTGTLVICSSHSGNTEETLNAFDTAIKNDCRVLALTTGGKLARKVGEANLPVWTFEHKGQPRAAVGFSFGLILGALSRLGLVPDASVDIVGAVEAMKSQQAALHPEKTVFQNPAKRLAGQLMGRWITVYGAGALTPVARRWKGQFNEVAKAAANFEFIPEANHNTLAGLVHPKEVLEPHTATVFLRAPSDHPRNRLRLDKTYQHCMLEGLPVDKYTAKGDTLMAHIWTALHFGDFVAYYLAMAYGVNPTPVTALEDFKAALKNAK